MYSVLSIEDYSNDRKSPVFTFGSISRKASDIIADFNTTKKTVDKVVDQSTGKIKDSALNKAGLVLKTDFDRHVSNSNIHVTADEKAVWNSKEKAGAADARSTSKPGIHGCFRAKNGSCYLDVPALKTAGSSIHHRMEFSRFNIRRILLGPCL
ncbi:hypothetical protein QNN00_14590 [Bacillus velezensis]|nr:hypothetical protein [Bacillus velezensis]